MVAVLQSQKHGAAPFATYTDSLHKTQKGQQKRRAYANLIVGGYEADNQGAESHQKQSSYECRLSTDTVAEMAKNNSAQRPSNKPNCESAESQDLADKRIERREKEPGKDESCSRAIQEEVVPFNGRPHGAGDDGLNQGASVPVRRCIELANLELPLV